MGDPWKEDTLVLVFSTTKGVSALTVATAHSRGLLDYDEKVATYWPEFGQAGKEPTPRTLFAFGCSLAVDRSHERLVVALTRGDAFGCDFVYAPEVLLSERYVYSRGVLLQVLAAFGTGNRDDVLTLVQKPRQCELTQHDAVLGGDLLDSLDQL